MSYAHKRRLYRFVAEAMGRAYPTNPITFVRAFLAEERHRSDSSDGGGTGQKWPRSGGGDDSSCNRSGGDAGGGRRRGLAGHDAAAEVHEERSVRVDKLVGERVFCSELVHPACSLPMHALRTR